MVSTKRTKLAPFLETHLFLKALPWPGLAEAPTLF